MLQLMSSRVPTLLASGWSGAKMLPLQTKSTSSLACSRVSASSLPSFLAANKYRGFPQSLQVTTSRTLAAVTGTFCVSVSAVVDSRSQSGCCCRDGRSFSVVHSPHDSEKQCCCWHARSCSAPIELRRSTPVVDFFFFFSSCRKLRARVTRNREIKNSGLTS